MVVLVTACNDDEVTPKAKIAANNGSSVVLTVKKLAGNQDTLIMVYGVNGAQYFKKTIADSIVLDTAFAPGTIITLDCEIRNSIGQYVTSAYRFTKITKSDGTIAAGHTCSNGKLNCSVFCSYTVE